MYSRAAQMHASSFSLLPHEAKVRIEALQAKVRIEARTEQTQRHTSPHSALWQQLARHSGEYTHHLPICSCAGGF